MRILLVDDEEQVLKGVSRLISCEEEDWEVATALTGEAALEALVQETFDVVVSDMCMPGMDGAQLLDEIGQKYPSMLRVILSGQADRKTVLRAVKTMHQYLAKPCDPKKLFEVINRAKIFQETIKSTEILDAIGRANCLPSFPEVVNELNREIDSDVGTSKSIAEVVSKDPVLSARLLQLANSAIFALDSSVADLDRAISLIGMELIRSLALSQSVYSGRETNDRILSAQRLLDHGFKVAVTGKKLAKHVGSSIDDGNIVFAAGLLHDVGKLILLNAFPEKYKLVVDSVKNSGQSIEQIEMETFGATHQGIGAYLFGLWGLPAEVTESVASHHSFLACAHAVGQPRQLVFAANWIVRNRKLAELQKLVEDADDMGEAERFAQQIAEWQNYIAKSEREE